MADLNTGTAVNPYDQFDTPASSEMESNPYDQFDPPPQEVVEEPQPESWTDTLKAIPAQVRGQLTRSIAGMQLQTYEELEAAYANGTPEHQAELPRIREKIAEFKGIINETVNDADAAPKGEQSLMQRGVQGAATSLVASAPALAVGIATRSPALAVSSMYAPTEGNAYAQFRTGKDALAPEAASKHAAVQGIIEVGTEAIPAVQLFKKGTAPFKRLVNFLAAELPGESVATVTQKLDETIAKAPGDVTAGTVVEGLAAGMKDLPETWVSTILGGGAQVAIAHAGAGPSSVKPKAAEPEKSPLDAIEQAAQNAREETAARGGDNLDQEVAAAMAAADHSTEHAQGVDDMNKQVEQMQQRFQASDDYAYGDAQQQEDAARAKVQEDAAANYEAQKIQEVRGEAAVTPEQGFQQAEADQSLARTAEEQIAYEQKANQDVTQAMNEPGAEPVRPTLGDVMPQEVKELANPYDQFDSRVDENGVEIPAGTEFTHYDVPGSERGGYIRSTVEKPAATTLQERREAPLALPAPKVAQIEVDSQGTARQVTEGELDQRKPMNGLALRRKAVQEERPRLPVQEINRQPESQPQVVEPAAGVERADSPIGGSVAMAAEAPAKTPTDFNGLSIDVENEPGSVRQYKNEDGTEGERVMKDRYGEIRDTVGADGQPVDIFVGEDKSADKVYVIDQVRQSDGAFDEHKVMVGYPNQLAAVKAYKRNYQSGWKVGPVKEMSRREFDRWKQSGKTQAPVQPEKITPSVPASKDQVKESATLAERRGRDSKVRYRENETEPVVDEPSEKSIRGPRNIEPESSPTEPKTTDGQYEDLNSHIETAIREIDNASLEGNDKFRVRRDRAKLEALKAEAAVSHKTPERVRQLHAKLAKVTGIDAAPMSLKANEPGRKVPAPSVSVDEAKARLQNMDVEVHNTPEDAPESIRKQALADGQMDARGAYDPDTDTVYVFAGNHNSADEIELTAAHEAIGHKGVRKVLGPKFEKTMQDVYETASNKAWLEDFIHQHGMDAANEAHRSVAADEYIASIAEGNLDGSLLRRVIDAVRAGLRRIGFVRKWTDDDIRALLRKSRSALGRSSGHAKPAPTGLRYASKDLSKANKRSDDHPLSVYIKQGATVEEQANYSPSVVRSRMDALKDFGENNIDKYLAVVPLRNLQDHMPPSKMTAMPQYARKLQALDGRRNELLSAADALAKRWMNYTGKNKDGARVLGEMMHASTLAGVDPSAPYKALHKGEKLTDDKAKIERERKAQWAALRKFWDKMDSESKTLYTEVRDSYAADRKLILTNLEARIEATEAEGKTKQSLIAELRRKFEAGQVQGPYFPLARFGKHFAVAKDAEGGVVSFSRFEKPSEQRAWAREMQSAGFKVDLGTKQQDNQMMKRIDPAFVAKVTDLLDEVDPSLADEVWQHYLRLMPEMSMRKHFIHRKGRLGFSADALRAFGNQKFHGAHQIAKLEHMHDLENILDQIKVQAAEQGGTKDEKWAAALADEFGKRHEWVRNPQSAYWATALTSFGFAMYLGLSPASALVNLTQTPMVALPTLAAKFNWMGAGVELTKAASQFWAGKGSMESKLRGDELRAFEDAKKAGLFSKTMAADLAGIGEEGTDYGSVRQRAAHIISYMFSRAEEANRQVTYIAAYRLARAKGLDHEAGVLLADDLTWDSHFDYSTTNRPRVMQSDFAKVLLLFRQYSMNMTYRLARDVNDSLRGATPERKREARMRFAGIWGQTALFAGASGMPLYWVVKAVLDSVFGDDDEPFDTDAAVRAHLGQTYGEEAARFVMDGPVDTVTRASISSRVGLNNLWLQEAPAGLEGKQLAFFYGAQAAGPVFGLFVRGFEAADSGVAGEKAIEKITPKAVSDTLKALRYARDGVTTTRGDVILAPDELSTYEKFLQSLGFTPAKVAAQNKENFAIKEYQTVIGDRKAALKNQLFLAMANKDRQEAGEVMKEIQEFNRKNPSVAIKADNLWTSAMARAKFSAEAINGVRVEPGLRYLHHKLDTKKQEEK